VEPLILVGVAALFLIIGVPIGICFAIGMISVMFLFGRTNLQFIAQSMYSGLDSLPLLAVPCFMLAGAIMDTGGLSKRLVNVANKLIGNSTGGLGTAVILACFFFGAISGSGPATTAAIGSIMIPHMMKANYDRSYSAGLVACAGGLGVIVPPSIPMVIYGCATNTSIGDLFLSGFGPAVVIAVILIGISIFISGKKGYKGSGEKASLREIRKAVWDAKWALIMPVVVLGGIYGGVFTPTEAAVVAIVYGVIIGLFVYKELKWKDLITIFDKNTSFVGGILLTFAPAAALGGVLAMMGIPKMVSDVLLSISNNLVVIMLIVNGFLLIAGMLMDTMSAIILFAPILMAVLTPLGMDPIHLGIIMVVNLAIGMVTPPVAFNLFVASGLTGIPMDKIVVKAIPFLVGLVVALMIITYIPSISLKILDFVH
jgi:C4-dicarboxylate transporter, DctM subunit